MPGIIRLLLAAYVITIPLDGLIQLPLLGGQLQLPEFIFLILLPVSGVSGWQHRSELKLPPWRMLDTLVIVYGFLVFISWLTSGETNALGEFLSVGYFGCLYFIVRIFGIRLDDLREGIPIALWLAAIGGLLAVGAYYVLGVEDYVVIHKDYYLLGDAIRAIGWSKSFLMLGEYLCVGILLVCFFYDWRRQIFLLAVAGLALYFTKSKSVFVLMGLLLVFTEWMGQIPIWLHRIARLGGICCLIAYLLISHVFIFGRSTEAFTDEASCEVYEFAGLQWVPTPYYHVKVATVRAFSEHPVAGIGGNVFIERTDEFFNRGLLSCNIHQTPHSTYFGAFVELGLFGGLLLLYATFHLLWLTWRSPNLLALVLFFIFQGITSDGMAFRHYWLLLAVFVNYDAGQSGERDDRRAKANLPV